MPDPGELPGMRRAVVPLVGAGLALVPEVVAHGVPRPPAVVGPLDDLPEPAARLRGVEPVGIGRRPLHVVHLPAPEVGPVHVPVLAGPVGREDERPFAGPDRHTHSAHRPRSSRSGVLPRLTLSHF